jgi:hypothetical protein
MLFPNETQTLLPFLTPCFARPRAKELESRSSASYVNRDCWWWDITLESCQEPKSRKGWTEVLTRHGHHTVQLCPRNALVQFARVMEAVTQRQRIQ